MHRYKSMVAVDIPCDVLHEVMDPPRSTKEKLAWDKSIKYWEFLEQVNEVTYV